jgi:hypothetical protein
MQRKDIKVGEVYAVRKSTSKHAKIVPAEVIDLDAPAKFTKRGTWHNHEESYPGGGVLVRFTVPVRDGTWDFALADETNENAGEVVETYVFHDRRDGAVGKNFVETWAAKQEREKRVNDERAERRRENQAQARDFAATLAAYRERLAGLGLDTEVHADGSGMYGDVHRRLYTAVTGEDGWGKSPVGFAHGDVEVGADVFEWLLKQAEATGATFGGKG